MHGLIVVLVQCRSKHLHSIWQSIETDKHIVFDQLSWFFWANAFLLPYCSSDHLPKRRTLILIKIRQFHSRCSSALMKYPASKHTIFLVSSNGLLRSIGYNWIVCIMGSNWQISLQICPSIAWLRILTWYFIIGRGWLVYIWTKCQPCSRIHLSSQVVANIYFGKSVSERGCTWLMIFINDVTTEWNGGLPFFREFFNVRINIPLDRFDVNVSDMKDINIVHCRWYILLIVLQIHCFNYDSSVTVRDGTMMAWNIGWGLVIIISKHSKKVPVPY